MTSPVRTFGEVCEIVMGQAPDGVSYNDAGEGLPLIAGAGDFGHDRPAAKKFTTAPTKTSLPNDIVMSIRATIGTKVLSDGIYCLGRGVAGLRPKSILDTRYLWHWLSKIEPNLSAKGRGATFPQVNRSDIAELPISLPPLDEQRRIAAILDKADALRHERRRVIKLLDSLTQSIFVEMFGDPQTNGMAYPKSSLGDVCTKITDGEHQNPNFTVSGMPIIMASQVGDEKVEIEAAKFVSVHDGERFRRKCGPEQGDILIVGRGATIGRTTAVDVATPFCLMGSVILLKPLNNIVNSTYLSVLLKHPKIQSDLYKTSGSSAQQAIYLSDLKKMSFPLPPIETQRAFANRMREITEIRRRCARQSEEIEQLVYSLQHCAFSGQL